MECKEGQKRGKNEIWKFGVKEQMHLLAFNIPWTSIYD
jgi:hypothetical protein